MRFGSAIPSGRQKPVLDDDDIPYLLNAKLTLPLTLSLFLTVCLTVAALWNGKPVTGPVDPRRHAVCDVYPERLDRCVHPFVVSERIRWQRGVVECRR